MFCGISTVKVYIQEINIKYCRYSSLFSKESSDICFKIFLHHSSILTSDYRKSRHNGKKINWIIKSYNLYYKYKQIIQCIITNTKEIYKYAVY